FINVTDKGDQGNPSTSAAPPTTPQFLSPRENNTSVQYPPQPAGAGNPHYPFDYNSYHTPKPPLSRFKENDYAAPPSHVPSYGKALRHTRTADGDLSSPHGVESNPLKVPFQHYLPQGFAPLPLVRPFSQPSKKRRVEEVPFVSANHGDANVSSYNVGSERRLSNSSQSLLKQMVSQPPSGISEEGPERLPSGNSSTVGYTSASPEPRGSALGPTSPTAVTVDKESSRRMRNAEASARCRKKKRDKEREEQVRNQQIRGHMESIWSKVTLYESRSAEEALAQLRAKQANPEDIMAKLVIKVENIIDDNRFLKRKVDELQAMLDKHTSDARQ
ncbi:hypothetical protein IWQ62_003889, partial [Dispira parvispora]